MQITVTFTSEKNLIDLRIDNKQRIKDTLNIIEGCGGLLEGNADTVRYVKSLRRNRRLSVFCSYEEAGIYSGDVLEICNASN